MTNPSPDDFMRQYIAELQKPYIPPVQPIPAAPELLPVAQYRDTLAAWWSGLPPSTREHPWSLDTVVDAAFSTRAKRPALRCVAQALRQLGFTERRDWTRAGRNRRQWLPPT